MKTQAQQLAEAITSDREKYGKSQEQIAEASGVTQQAVSGWQSGESIPRRPRLVKLAEFFGPESETARLVNALGVYEQEGIPAATHRRRDMPMGGDSSQARFSMRPMRTGFRNQAMGTQSGAGDKALPRTESGDDQGPHSKTESFISSFENDRFAEHPQEMIEALTRSLDGVTLARRVLDDAASQIEKALSNIKQ